MILFWLYHRLLFANEVKLIHSNRRRVAKKKKKKKLNRINSDKVHECSFKNEVGRTNTFIRSPFTQSHARAGTHTMFKWVRQPVNLLKTTPVICVCVCPVTRHTHTPQPASERVLTVSREQQVEAGSQALSGEILRWEVKMIPNFLWFQLLWCWFNLLIMIVKLFLYYWWRKEQFE